jgi:hypothetical protein
LFFWPAPLTHSIPGPITISDDEPAADESETDCSDLDVDFEAKSDSDRPHVADSEPAISNGFGVEATLNSDCLFTHHQDDDNDHDNDVANKTQLCLSVGHPISASLEPGPNTQHASKLQVNTDITQQSTSSPNLDSAKQVEDEGCDAFVKENVQDDNDAYSAKRSNLPAPSSKNPASDSTVSELQHSQVDHSQALQLGPAAASSHQSDLNNDHPPMRLRRGASGTVRDKRSEQEMDNDGSADDSDDKDYADMSDAGGPTRGGTCHSRKRFRRTKDREHNDMEGPSTPSLDVSCQSVAATSSSSMLESEEIPIHGYLTLQTIGSKVMYRLEFSQEPHQPSRTCVTGSRRELKQLPSQKQDTSLPARVRKKFLPKEDTLLRELKEDKCLSWAEITEQFTEEFPGRNKEALQVHYSTKLKRRIGTITKTKKRRRFE